MYYKRCNMVDYKQMYLIMVRASERAITIIEQKGNPQAAAQHLIQAQLDCEELYINGDDSCDL